jgi:hypothetical protein
MVIPLLPKDDNDPKPAPAQQQMAESHPRRAVVTAWVMPSVLALALVAAAVLNAVAASKRHREDEVIGENGNENDTDYKELFVQENDARNKYQEQFVLAREERDRLRKELEELKAQKPDTSVKDSDPQIEIKVADLRGRTMSQEAKQQACFDLINRGKQAPATLACIEDFKVGNFQVAFRDFPPPIRAFGNHDSIYPAYINNADGTECKWHLFSIFYTAWQELNNPKLYEYAVSIKATYQDDARNLFEVRCDLVFYPHEFLSHMGQRTTAIGPITSGTTGVIFETRNHKYRRVAPAVIPIDWRD